ncbi:hypothetical protein GOODEAATRI_011198 [Goodea atripinnis]|uniref:Cytidine and dCMP deaminase domain-containing protein 1 n=1 Tax=Goodea atripinnis TaxID=208336 RepID=A0ABV0PD72_9TELE
MGLGNFCVEPYFSNLRNNMTELRILKWEWVLLFGREGSRLSVVEQAAWILWVAGTTPILQAPTTQSTPKWTTSRRTVRDANTDTSSTQNKTPSPLGQLVCTVVSSLVCLSERFLIRRYVFRSQNIKPDELTMLFVTKCPCDECVPLIRGAGITHIYTSDQDRDKDKGDISYLRFSTLKDISKFVVSSQSN